MYTVWKVSKYGDFSGPYFLVFGLNTERSSVSLHMQSKCGKISTRKKPVFGHFSRSGKFSPHKDAKDVKGSKVASEQITAQNTKFSIKDFFSECDQHLLKKSIMENFIVYAVS